MADDMTGKVALVTGGGSGIGRAAVLAFAKRGATVATVDLDEAGGAETVRLAGELGAEVDFWRVDVSKAGEVEAMVSRVVASHGRLDYAYNNAGIEGPTGSLVDCSEADFDRVISVNLEGRLALHEVRDSGDGCCGRRRDSQHVVDKRVEGELAAGAVYGEQVRGGGAY